MGLFSTQISTKALAPVCRQLATSFGAGIPITRCLELVQEGTKDKEVREVIRDINVRIGNGSTLADAARTQSRYLPPLFIELLAAGEVGGHLDETLRDLSDYFEDRLALRREVIKKSAYPALQLFCAWFLGSFALGLARNMSFITKPHTKPYTFSTHLWWYAGFQFKAFLVVAAFIAGCVLLSRAGVLKWIWGWVATKCWPLSAVTLRLAQARFFRSFALLVKSGAPIVQAVRRSAAASGNAYVEEDFLRAIPGINNGQTLVEAFRASEYLSRTAREMLRVGEESGKVDEALMKVAEYQHDEAVQALSVAARVGQVMITLIVGCVVGYIVISFYGNYYGRMMDELKI